MVHGDCADSCPVYNLFRVLHKVKFFFLQQRSRSGSKPFSASQRSSEGFVYQWSRLRFAPLWRGAGSGSALKLNDRFGSTLKWCESSRYRTFQIMILWPAMKMIQKQVLLMLRIPPDLESIECYGRKKIFIRDEHLGSFFSELRNNFQDKNT